MTGLAGTPYDLVFHPTDSDRMAAATSQGLYATTNGGSTWSRVTTAFTGAWCVVVQEGTGDLLVGTNANGAWIWEGWSGTPTQIGSSMPNIRVNVLVDVPSYNRLYAGTFGSSMWMNDYGTGVEEGPSAPPAPFGFAVFPNPASGGTVTASFVLPGEGAGLLQVFDLAGRVVAQRTAASGEQQMVLDVSSLAPGVYFTRLAFGGESATARMVITR